MSTLPSMHRTDATDITLVVENRTTRTLPLGEYTIPGLGRDTSGRRTIDHRCMILIGAAEVDRKALLPALTEFIRAGQVRVRYAGKPGVYKNPTDFIRPGILVALLFDRELLDPSTKLLAYLKGTRTVPAPPAQAAPVEVVRLPAVVAPEPLPVPEIKVEPLAVESEPASVEEPVAESAAVEEPVVAEEAPPEVIREETVSAAPSSGARARVEAMSWDEMKAMAKDLGLKAGGISKEDMIEQLVMALSA